MKKFEREGLRIVKDALNMFDKAERAYTRKNSPKKPRGPTKKQLAKVQAAADREVETMIRSERFDVQMNTYSGRIIGECHGTALTHIVEDLSIPLLIE